MLKLLYEKFLQTKQNISTDSRKISPDCIFFALKGDNFDGNTYAQKAVQNGASFAVIDDPQYENEHTFLVDNVLETLQQLANYHRNMAGFKVLALTGTNGKTTTKELIHCVLASQFRCFATQGNLNNHIGVPLTILSTPQNAELLIVEMGANHKGEIKKLCQIAEPDYGLITNIGKAHLEGFGGFEGVVEAKSELYGFLKSKQHTIFYNASDPLLRKLLAGYTNTVKYNAPRSKCFPMHTSSAHTLAIEGVLDGEDFKITTNLFGEYNVTNIIAAMAIGSYFEVSKNKIIQSVNNFIPTNNRSQVLKTHYNTLILDSYNANPSSMAAALQSFDKIDSSNKILILGGMKELGNNSLEEHRKLVDLVFKMKAKNLYCLGEEFEGLNLDKGTHFQTIEELIKKLSENPIKNALIFIKGSRANKLEELVSYL